MQFALSSSLQSGRRDLLGTLLGRAESIVAAGRADRCEARRPPGRAPSPLLSLRLAGVESEGLGTRASRRDAVMSLGLGDHGSMGIWWVGR